MPGVSLGAAVLPPFWPTYRREADGLGTRRGVRPVPAEAAEARRDGRDEKADRDRAEEDETAGLEKMLAPGLDAAVLQDAFRLPLEAAAPGPGPPGSGAPCDVV